LLRSDLLLLKLCCVLGDDLSALVQLPLSIDCHPLSVFLWTLPFLSAKTLFWVCAGWRLSMVEAPGEVPGRVEGAVPGLEVGLLAGLTPGLFL
jgi:hypothetical protein